MVRVWQTGRWGSNGSRTPRESIFFFFQAEDGIRDYKVTGVQTCALPIYMSSGIGQTRDASNWWFGAQIMPKNVEALFDIINTELSAVFNSKVLEADIEIGRASCRERV